MTFYHFTFSSKNKKSLKKFFLTFLNKNTNNALKSKVIKNHFQKINKKKFISILKSPHVNKTAQEQFEFRKISKQLTLYQPKSLKYLYFLKKIKNNGLSDIKIKTKFSFNNIKNKNININVLNPKNFHYNTQLNTFNQKLTFKNFQIQKLKTFQKNIKNRQTKSFLKSLCSFGELKILNKFK